MNIAQKGIKIVDKPMRSVAFQATKEQPLMSMTRRNILTIWLSCTKILSTKSKTCLLISSLLTVQGSEEPNVEDTTGRKIRGI